jgi:hypothetical protein
MMRGVTAVLASIAGVLGVALGVPQVQQAIAGSFTQLVSNHPNLLAVFTSLAVILSLIHNPTPQPPSSGSSSAVKNSLGALVILALGFLISGCNGYTLSQNVHTVVANAIVLAQDELPGLQAVGVLNATEAPVVSGYIALASNLNNQFESCVTNAQQTALKTNAKFLACLNIFSAGLNDPKELALLKVLNPKAQQKVQLWAGFFAGTINIAITDLGGMTNATPVIAPAPATSAELHDFAKRAIALGR